MKLNKPITNTDGIKVASFAEAWIEIQTLKGRAKGKNVASFAEAWIEIVIRLYE